MAASGAFATTRAYLSEGTGESPARLFLNDNFKQNFQVGPHQHAIVLAGENKMRCVYAVVIVFGALSYLVQLSAVYEGADFSQTYAYDAQKGEQCPVIVAKVDNEFHLIHDVLEGATIWNDTRKSADSFMAFLSGELGFKFEQ